MTEIKSEKVEPFTSIVYNKKNGNIILNHRYVTAGIGPIPTKKETEIELKKVLEKIKVFKDEEVDIITVESEKLTNLNELCVDTKERKLVSRT